jgi:hypothetical protein
MAPEQSHKNVNQPDDLTNRAHGGASFDRFLTVIFQTPNVKKHTPVSA